MSDAELRSLIRMLNQIAANLDSEDQDAAAKRVEAHLRRFWARSMKERLAAYLQADGSELSPLARRAAARLSSTTGSETTGSKEGGQSKN
jgi:formate dehydrogenase subunit delta